LFAVYLVVFGGFACLFPLALYWLILASWNKRRRPFLVRGSADFAGVLLATSGFLTVVGPLILWGLHDASRRSAAYPTFAAAWAVLGPAPWPWLLPWIGYFLLVGGGSLWLLNRRGMTAVVYNIAGDDADRLFPMTLDRMGLTHARRGSELWIETPQPDGLRRAIVEVTVAPVLRTLAFRWVAAPGKTRQEVEAAIRDELTIIDTPRNPLAGWFLTLACGLFAVMILLLGWFIALVYRLRP
jgi:hypothetical protein